MSLSRKSYFGSNRDDRRIKRPRSYAEFLESEIKRGHWSPVFREWTRAFGTLSAALLSHLLTVGKVKADDGGWIIATALFVERGVGISERDQADIIDRLERKEILEVKWGSKVRSIRIDLDALEKALR